ncbi:MAG: nucleotidyltransferase domain-containing protein [Clostridiales bacterium]|nr:nucleotidyltransferase domain-containing protein [Clostridiales bacterium]
MKQSIEKMTARISRILDGKIRSAWLYGSVALEDFRPGWSDIDLLVLTEGRITPDQAGALLTLRQAMTEEEPENRYYRAFEGIIADEAEYRTASFTRLVYWGTSGQRITDRYAQDAFSAFELAKYGRCVCGDGDRSIFAAPTAEEMEKAVRRHYDTVRRCAVRTNESLYSCGWLLDIARCIYTLRHGGVISKTGAGVWALKEHIFEEEEPLRKALAVRREPMAYKDRDDVKQWLKGLGPTVQRYADALEKELRKHAS